MTTSTASSNTHTLTCRMAAEAAAIERLCQVTRIRGFRIEHMEVHADSEGLSINMTVSGERKIDMLRSQIEKLHTVQALFPNHSAQSVKQDGLRQTA